MEAKDIEKLVRKAKDDIEKEVRDRLPRKVGVVAVNHFRQNFRDAGWRDNGLHPWKKTRWQQGGGPEGSSTQLCQAASPLCINLGRRDAIFNRVSSTRNRPQRKVT